MFQINEIMTIPPFSVPKEDKALLYNKALSSLTKHHYRNCSIYKTILDAFKYSHNDSYSYDQLPFLPVRLFKYYKLLSVREERIIKIMFTF